MSSDMRDRSGALRTALARITGAGLCALALITGTAAVSVAPAQAASSLG